MKYLLLFTLLLFLENYICYGYQIKVAPDWRQRNCHLETVLSLSISKSEGESMQKNEKTHNKRKATIKLSYQKTSNQSGQTET